jgi:1,4-dihydroxy-2-naphthoate octaprenyltransferase
MKNSDYYIFDRDTLLHLRLPFSFFLLPVYLFALSQSETINILNAVLVFIALHFFIYPGSNIYNSFMDEDKGSIGALKNPPPVTRKLFYASIFFDLAGLLICAFCGIKMVLLMLPYVGVSKLYSWKKTRLKKYALTGWLTVVLFQGAYTYLLINMAVENQFSVLWFTTKNAWAMLLVSLLIGAYYPLTQIYQHDEDSDRGDFTISYLLGIKGTFYFAILLFTVALAVATKYFCSFYTVTHFYIFTACLIPVIGYFFFWLYKVFKDESAADFNHAMRMTFLSSCSLVACYVMLLYINHH